MNAKAKVKPKQVPAAPTPVLPTGCESLMSRAQVAHALSVSVRSLNMMLAAHEFPGPHAYIGKRARWRTASVSDWIREKCGPARKDD